MWGICVVSGLFDLSHCPLLFTNFEVHVRSFSIWFLFSLLNIVYSMYILCTGPSLCIWLTNVFSRSIGCLFSVVSFDVWKVLVEVVPFVCFLLLLPCPLTHSQIKVYDVPLMFSFIIIFKIVLSITFKNLIYLN